MVVKMKYWWWATQYLNFVVRSCLVLHMICTNSLGVVCIHRFHSCEFPLLYLKGDLNSTLSFTLPEYYLCSTCSPLGRFSNISPASQTLSTPPVLVYSCMFGLMDWMSLPAYITEKVSKTIISDSTVRPDSISDWKTKRETIKYIVVFIWMYCY